jgi:hypothetical protein
MAPAERPGVVHFVTGVKPWKPSSLSVNAPLYDAFRRRTGFARSRRDRLSDAAQTTWCHLKRRLRRLLGVVRALGGGVERDVRRITRH